VEPEPDIAPARIGGFRVLRRLSSGATTDVLLARAEGPHGFERVVALKVLLQQFQSDPAFERLFAREASAYARLSHPAIVKLYDFFSTDGRLVMVLEYVDGLPLHKLRAMLSIGGERLEDSAALFIGSRVFAALGAAHSARDPENGEFAPVIHRDINPSNVLVPWDGHVKISDFGIAKIGGTDGDTRLGFVKGTYGYMAPEQVRGENVTVRADVYAATLVLWELLARRKAIQRGAMPEVEVLKAMANPEFPSLDALRPDLPAKVRETVRRGLEPNPDRRSITADEVAAVLRLATGGDDGRARLADAIARVRPPPSDGHLAVTTAHAVDLETTVKSEREPQVDPDETVRISTRDLPEDSGAFKRSEIELDPGLGSPVEEPPKSSGELTMIEARRPATSDPPPTLPPTSEPRTLAPETLSLPHTASETDWREPSQGFVRANVAAEQPQTLRFGPSEAPPANQDPKASPVPLLRAAPVAPLAPVAKVTLISAIPPAPPQAHEAALTEPKEPRAKEPSLPRFPMPSMDALPPPVLEPVAAAAPIPIAPGSPPVAPSPLPLPALASPPPPLTERARQAARPTLRTVRRSPSVGLLVAVVLGSALIGIGVVEAYLHLRSPGETANPIVATTRTAPASKPKPPQASATTPAAAGAPAASPAPSAAASTPPAATSATTASTAAAPTASALPSQATVPSAAPAGSDVPVPSPTPVPPGQGDILTKPSVGGHRIYVDDRVVGNSPEPVRVRCGRHDVRIGSAGTPRDVDVPCGGSIVVNP
jgi:serine/threonine-protein kinase